MSKLFPDERRARELPDLTGRSELNVASVHASLYSSSRRYWRTVFSVEVQPLDERIRQLCAKAAAADDSEVEAILAELQRLLHEHNEFVRAMVSRTMNRVA